MGEKTSKVVISGVGVVSAVGIGKTAFWTGLTEGRNGVQPIEAFDTSAYRTHKGGEVKNFSPPLDAAALGRATQFAITAVREALADSGLNLSSIPPFRVSVSLGTTMGESQLLERINDR